jgi:hypothetical protein
VGAPIPPAGVFAAKDSETGKLDEAYVLEIRSGSSSGKA